MVEMSWARAEPSEGTFDSAYLDAVRGQISALRAAGLKVVLNYGLHHAPTWLLAKPNARFVNQAGQTYTGSDEANLIFATALRSHAEAYTTKVFSTLGTDFVAVRAGGGHWGELQYPAVVDATTGKIRNDYWAFDGAAAVSNPVPGWRPGANSPNGEARKFLTWYLDHLAEYQNWQIASIRRSGYSGTIGVLYASWGMRAGDFDKAVSTNLSGTSSPEINGEVQRGYDHARLAAALTDRNIALWGTWAEKVGTLSWLSSLAKPRGLGLMGENSGSDTSDKMAATKTEAVMYGASLMMWIRASELYCGCGYATIEDFNRVAAS
jgi:hypothetical protein